MAKSRIYALAVALVAMALLGGAASPSQAATALEDAIASAIPCAGNKTKVAGTTIGIDKFDRVEIKEFSVSGKGSAGKASVTGFLSCKTSDQAVVRGDANADFDVSASIDLNTCAITSKSVEIPKTGGRFKLVVDLLKSKIIESLEGSIVSEAKKLCKR